MKAITILQLTGVAAAFVLPNEQVDFLEHVQVESRDGFKVVAGEASLYASGLVEDVAPVAERVYGEVRGSLGGAASAVKNALDAAVQYAQGGIRTAQEELPESYFDAQAWAEYARGGYERAIDFLDLSPDDEADPEGCHHTKPTVYELTEYARGGYERAIDFLDLSPDDEADPEGCHHTKPTVYELIASSEHTTILAKLISEDKDLVKKLNSTEAHVTVFAPLDSAFEKIPVHHKPSKELLDKVLSYHVSPGFYPLSRILKTRTVPTLLEASVPGPQRLSTQLSLFGATINFYSRIVAVNIFGSNGVIHGVNNIIIPPPPVETILNLLPIEFSTLRLGLIETGLVMNENQTHVGGTLFAPSNLAFLKLGHLANAFLFSSYGRPYLKALLKYHIVPSETLYSDAYYNGTSVNTTGFFDDIPRGTYHYTLPTFLGDKVINADIKRFGRLVDFRLNAFTSVSVSDGVAYDGVVHGLSEVLIPPHHEDCDSDWTGGEISVEALKSRIDPYLEASERVQDAVHEHL